MATLDVRPPVGFILSQHPEEVSTTRQHEVGLTFTDQKGRVFMYCLANAAIAGQGYVVQIDANGDATELTTAIAADFGMHIGVNAANEDVADNEYFWACMKKPASDTELGVVTLVSAGADSPLYTSATDGALDDAATSQSLMQGVRLLVATPTTATVMNVNSEWDHMRITIA